MDHKSTCCVVTTMCGYSLHHGVIFVGTMSTLISVIMLAHAVVCVGTSAPAGKGLNGQPVMAVNMLFGLYSTSVSLYQILISLLLVWQAVRTKGDIFLCTLWHVSHLSILLLYCFLFTAKVVVCFVAKQYFTAVSTAVVGLLYQTTFIYFLVVVNSFSNTIDEDVYY